MDTNTNPGRGRGRPPTVDFDQAAVNEAARKWAAGEFCVGSPAPEPGEEIKHVVRGLLADADVGATGLARAIGLSPTAAYRWLNGYRIGTLTWKAVLHWHAALKKDRDDAAAKRAAIARAAAAEDAHGRAHGGMGMNEATEAIARRAIACDGWRPLRGMRGVFGVFPVRLAAHPDLSDRNVFVGDGPTINRDAGLLWLPDFDDPLTLGGLLYLARVVSGNPGLVAERVVYADGRVDWLVRSVFHRRYQGFASEADALVAVLEQGWACIRKEPSVCGGAACIAGTRIPVWTIVAMRQDGASDREIKAAYPGVVGDGALLSAFGYAACHPEEIRAAISANALEDQITAVLADPLGGERYVDQSPESLVELGEYEPDGPAR